MWYLQKPNFVMLQTCQQCISWLTTIKIVQADKHRKSEFVFHATLHRLLTTQLSSFVTNSVVVVYAFRRNGRLINNLIVTVTLRLKINDRLWLDSLLVMVWYRITSPFTYRKLFSGETNSSLFPPK